MSSDTTTDLDALRGILDTVVAPWVAELGLRLQAARLGEVLIHDPQGALAAHATTTYSLL